MKRKDIPFQSGAIRPGECMRGGWDFIKNDFWMLLGVSLLGIFIGGLFAIVLMGPMMCGIYLCLFRRERGEPTDIGVLFKGFDYFLESFIATLLMAVPVIVILVPLYIVMMIVFFASMPRGPGQAPNFTPIIVVYVLFWVALLVVNVVSNVLFFFVYPLIAEHRMSGMDAVKLSLRAAMANLGGLFGLVLIQTLLGVAGFFACCIGMWFFLPIDFAANLIAYRQVFPEGATPIEELDDPPDDWPLRTDIQKRRD